MGVTRNLMKELTANSEMRVKSSETTSVLSVFERPSDLLLAFGLGQKTDVLDSHLPAIGARRDQATWANLDDRSVKKVLGVIRAVISQVIALFCDGADESVDAIHQRLMPEADDGASIAPRTMEGIMQVARFIATASRGSIEKRVARAFLCSLMPYSKICVLQELVPDFTLSRKSFTKANADFRQLTENGQLHVERRSVKRYDPKIVESAIKFILSPDHVSFVSWGSKRVNINGQRHLFPAILRKHAKKRIYELYKASTAAQKQLSRSAIYQLISTLTAGPQRARKAIDYVAGFLVYDSFDVIRRMIDNLQLPAEKRADFRSKAEKAQVYLKYGFDYHIRDPECKCLLADRLYSLQGSAPRDPTLQVCTLCKELFAFLSELRKALEDHAAHESTLTVIDDCAARARLFLGHRVRVVNQQIALQRVVDEMKTRCLEQRHSDEAVILLDFKMKFDPVHLREKTVEHYGKRGISWHGAMVHYFKYEEVAGEPTAVDERIYIDGIAGGDGKQDRETVISLLEAIIIRMCKEQPHIRRITLQSDNASCYNNTLILLFLPYLSARYGVCIERFIHSETQDGKSVLDARFARSMPVVNEWVSEGNNCVTPAQLAMALKNHGGLPNCIVELIDHDRDQLKQLVDTMASLEKSVRKLVGRANGILIEMMPARVRPECMSNYRDCPEFNLRVFDYSHIGSGRTVRCDPFTQVGTLVSRAAADDQTQDEGDEDDDADIEPDIHSADLDSDDDDADDDEQDESDAEYTDDTFISPQSAQGSITGVQIVTQGQLCRRTRNWRRHTVTILDTEGTGVKSRSLIAFAVDRALQLHTDGAFGIYDPRLKQAPATNTPRPASDSTAAKANVFSRGWAIRPPKGQMYGRRYASEFEKEIEELIEIGVKNKSRKMGPGRMVENLQRKSISTAGLKLDPKPQNTINYVSGFPTAVLKTDCTQINYDDRPQTFQI